MIRRAFTNSVKRIGDRRATKVIFVVIGALSVISGAVVYIDTANAAGTFTCKWADSACVVDADTIACEAEFTVRDQQCADLNQNDCEGGEFSCRSSVGISKAHLGLAEKVSNTYTWALGIGGMVALGIIIFGGVLYSASGGNPGRIEEAKKWIQHALFGLALLLSSYLLLNFINPDLTSLEEVFLDPNPRVEGPTLERLPGAGGLVGGIEELLMPPNIGSPMVDGYYQMPPPATPGLYVLNTNECGGDRELASACGNIETIQVLYTVATAWRENYPSEAPLYIRDINGDYLENACTTSRHETHELGTDADVLIGNYSVDDRIALAKLFIDTGYVTGILHSPGTLGSQPSSEAYRYINEVNAYFEQTQGDRLTPWNGQFARLDLDAGGRIKGHYAHFHVHVGDCFGGAAGTGIGCGIDCNTNCYVQTGCNP